MPWLQDSTYYKNHNCRFLKYTEKPKDQFQSTDFIPRPQINEWFHIASALNIGPFGAAIQTLMLVLNFQKQASKHKLITFHFQHLIRFWSALVKLRRNHIFKRVGWGRNFPNLHIKELKHQNYEVPHLVYFIRLSSIPSHFVAPLQIMMEDVRICKTPKNNRSHFGSHVLKKKKTHNPKKHNNTTPPQPFLH